MQAIESHARHNADAKVKSKGFDMMKLCGLLRGEKYALSNFIKTGECIDVEDNQWKTILYFYARPQPTLPSWVLSMCIFIGTCLCVSIRVCVSLVFLFVLYSSASVGAFFFASVK